MPRSGDLLRPGPRRRTSPSRAERSKRGASDRLGCSYYLASLDLKLIFVGCRDRSRTSPAPMPGALFVEGCVAVVVTRAGLGNPGTGVGVGAEVPAGVLDDERDGCRVRQDGVDVEVALKPDRVPDVPGHTLSSEPVAVTRFFAEPTTETLSCVPPMANIRLIAAVSAVGSIPTTTPDPDPDRDATPLMTQRATTLPVPERPAIPRTSTKADALNAPVPAIDTLEGITSTDIPANTPLPSITATPEISSSDDAEKIGRA